MARYFSYLLFVAVFTLLNNASFAQLDSLWNASQQPLSTVYRDGPVEIGSRFEVKQNANLSHVRWFAARESNYRIRVWDQSRNILHEQTAHMVPGWNRVELTLPVVLKTGNLYTVSILTPRFYRSRQGVYNQHIETELLVAKGDYYLYNGAGGYPIWAWQNSSYYITPVINSTINITPLTLQVGKDTVILAKKNDTEAADFILKATATGDNVQFIWEKIEPTWQPDTILNGNQSTAIARGLMVGTHLFGVTAKDKYGNTKYATISVDVTYHPKTRQMYLTQDNLWYMLISKLPGFNVEEDNVPDPNKIIVAYLLYDGTIEWVNGFKVQQ